MSAVENLNTFL